MAKRRRPTLQVRARKDAQATYLFDAGHHFVVLGEDGAVIAQGSYENMRKHHPDAKLPPPLPSSPARPPKHHIECYSDGRLVFTSKYYADYAAVHFLDAIIDTSKIKWKSPEELYFDIDDRRLILKGDTLEALLDKKLTNEEKAWELPTPIAEQCQAFRKGAKVNITPNSSTEVPRDRSVRSQRSERQSTVRRTEVPDGYVSLGDIVASVGCSPREARQVLRKHEDKPACGWAWPKKEVERITKLLKANA